MDTYRTLLEINNAVINCLSQAQLQEAATAVVRRLIPCDDAGLSFFAPGTEPARPPEPVLRRDGLRSQLTAPLIARGEPIGVLGVGSLEPAKYSAEDSHFFEQVAAQLALAAANVRAIERLQGSGGHAPGEAHSALPASDSLFELERRHISATLERCRWVIEGNRGAAKALGLHPNTLRHRLRKLELKRPSKPPT